LEFLLKQAEPLKRNPLSKSTLSGAAPGTQETLFSVSTKNSEAVTFITEAYSLMKQQNPFYNILLLTFS
jgi:hypothetical protein